MPTRSILETRYDQILPRLRPKEIERLRRFGELRTYPAGERLIVSAAP